MQRCGKDNIVKYYQLTANPLMRDEILLLNHLANSSAYIFTNRFKKTSNFFYIHQTNTALLCKTKHVSDRNKICIRYNNTIYSSMS